MAYLIPITRIHRIHHGVKHMNTRTDVHFDSHCETHSFNATEDSRSRVALSVWFPPRYQNEQGTTIQRVF